MTISHEKMDSGILSTIGRTPLVRLHRLCPEPQLKLYAKLEFFNPGGSAKDRPALRMMKTAIEEGKITPDTVIIESSSGNMAISLAKICCLLGLRFICVIDPKTTPQNISLMQAYQAQIEYVFDPDPETGEFLPARLNRVKSLLQRYPNSYWPNQYGNPNNYLAHYHTTMKEIIDELPKVDYLFCGVSTCGTIRGCSLFARDHGLDTKIIAVDAAGSIIFGGEKGKRRFPGLGAGIVPPFSERELIDQLVYVSDLDCVTGCRRLAQTEAILAGASSGGVIAAFEKVKGELPPGSVSVVIIHDLGDRYLDTVYSDDWVKREFGDVLHLWKS